MRNIRKSSTLESKFPLLAVEQGCIISKDGDITVAYEVTLPEIFTVTSQEYESVHAAWCKAIKVLPDYSIVHKQDWFVKENYAPDLQNSDMSFLSRSYERHFNERPYLHHQCYQGAYGTPKQFFHFVPWAYHSQGNQGQGNGSKIPRCRGAVRKNHQRLRLYLLTQTDGRGNHRHGANNGTCRQVPLALHGERACYGKNDIYVCFTLK